MVNVQSDPSVDVPEKPAQPAGFQPMAMTEVTDNTIHQEEELKKEQSEEASTSATNSPSQPKLAFGLKKQSFPTTNSKQSSKMDGIFASEDSNIEEKPKKKLVPIEYSDDEMPVQNQSRDEKGREERRRDRDRGEMDDRHRSNSSRSPKSSRRSRHSSSSRSGGRRDERGGSDKAGNEVGYMLQGRGGVGDGIMMEEGMKDRKLTPEERKRVVQQLVNIPTSKEEVFKYKLKWNQIDNVCLCVPVVSSSSTSSSSSSSSRMRKLSRISMIKAFTGGKFEDQPHLKVCMHNKKFTSNKKTRFCVINFKDNLIFCTHELLCIITGRFQGRIDHTQIWRGFH